MAKDICGKAYRLVMKKTDHIYIFLIPLFGFDLGKVKEHPPSVSQFS